MKLIGSLLLINNFLIILVNGQLSSVNHNYTHSNEVALTFGQGSGLVNNCTLPNEVALTFDDGPHPTLTPQLLDLLQEQNVTATFFIRGLGGFEYNETRYRATVLRTFTEGHQIGSHSWSHHHMKNLTTEEVREELSSLESLIVDIIGKRPSIFRPPYGEYNDQLIGILQEEYNYMAVLWNVDTMDWSHPGDTQAGLDAWVEGVDGKYDAGLIGLHHDVFNGTVELANATIHLLTSRGFRFVSVSECIGVPMYQD